MKFKIGPWSITIRVRRLENRPPARLANRPPVRLNPIIVRTRTGYLEIDGGRKTRLTVDEFNRRRGNGGMEAD